MDRDFTGKQADPGIAAFPSIFVSGGYVRRGTLNVSHFRELALAKCTVRGNGALTTLYTRAGSNVALSLPKGPKILPFSPIAGLKAGL